MPNDRLENLVIDASVAAKFWFEEPLSQTVRDRQTRWRLIAPDFLVIEMASIAAKQVRRGLASSELAGRAVEGVGLLVDSLAPSAVLAPRAFEVARDHGVSAYDGLYLALAEREGFPVLTADEKLVSKVRSAGLGHLVRPLTESDPPAVE